MVAGLIKSSPLLLFCLPLMLRKKERNMVIEYDTRKKHLAEMVMVLEAATPYYGLSARHGVVWLTSRDFMFATVSFTWEWHDSLKL